VRQRKGWTLRSENFSFLLLVLLCGSLLAGAQTDDSPAPSPTQTSGDFAVDNPDAVKLPKNVILVKGAVPSASDGTTPLPETGTIAEKIYTNPYFGLTFAFPSDWHQKYAGPPPSDSGYYVLTQIEPSKSFKGPAGGSILVSAQDLFFGHTPVKSAVELVNVKKSRLNAEYKVERQPVQVNIAGQQFYRMDYMSPVAELHWYTLTTQVRCHSVEFMLTSRDTELLESIVKSMDALKLSDENAPVCVKNYASGDNILLRRDPILTDRKFNPIPVRIVIDRYGKVKHVHVISAFPDQAKIISDALLQWEFKPYKQNGEPVEIETGIMFGKATGQVKTAGSFKE
jgi:hypothetical protein